jgi:hypothetical protein
MSNKMDNRIVSATLFLTQTRLNVEFSIAKNNRDIRPKYLSITRRDDIAQLTKLVSKFGLTLYDISQECDDNGVISYKRPEKAGFESPVREMILARWKVELP